MRRIEALTDSVDKSFEWLFSGRDSTDSVQLTELFCPSLDSSSDSVVTEQCLLAAGSIFTPSGGSFVHLSVGLCKTSGAAVHYRYNEHWSTRSSGKMTRLRLRIDLLFFLQCLMIPPPPPHCQHWFTEVNHSNLLRWVLDLVIVSKLHYWHYMCISVNLQNNITEVFFKLKSTVLSFH